MTLWDLKKSQIAVITGLDLALNQKVSERLDEMGFAAEQEVTCFRHGPLNGPTVVYLGGSAFALEQDIAKSVFVRPL